MDDDQLIEIQSFGRSLFGTRAEMCVNSPYAAFLPRLPNAPRDAFPPATFYAREWTASPVARSSCRMNG